MKHKTPMQVAIQTLQNLLEMDYTPNEYSDGYKKCVKDVVDYLKEKMLQKEKDVMNKAWDEAADCLEEFKTFEEYYNETFKTNEE